MFLSYPNAFIGYPASKNRTKSGFPLKTTAGMTGVTRTFAGMTGVTRTLTMMFFGFRSRSGPFEGPACVKPPALPEDIYYPSIFFI
jgi:hypothetical protein